MRSDACDGCLRRSALVAALAGPIDVGWRRRNGRARLLSLADEELLAMARHSAAREAILQGHARFAAGEVRAGLQAAGVHAVCRCSDGYPDSVRDLEEEAPAVLHVLGRPELLHQRGAAAVVGSRSPTRLGEDVAVALGRGLAVAGVPSISGMALGIDSAVHRGGLAAGSGEAPTVAVLACGVDVAYPRSARGLHAALAQRGAVVSEMPLGTGAWRWAFPARNRIIAALGAVTVVVEAAERSGSLITASLAADLGRTVGAVPGPVTSRRSAGTNSLLHDGASVVRDTADVLDLLGLHVTDPAAPDAGARQMQLLAADPLAPKERRVLDALESGAGTVTAIADHGIEPREAMAVLARLEVRGLVRRGTGGRYERSLGS